MQISTFEELKQRKFVYALNGKLRFTFERMTQMVRDPEGGTELIDGGDCFRMINKRVEFYLYTEDDLVGYAVVNKKGFETDATKVWVERINRLSGIFL